MGKGSETREGKELGALLEQFINRIAHPRGEALRLMGEASVTTAQAILLDLVRRHPGSKHTELARALRLSLSSVSQMVERLVKGGLLARQESPKDRRVRTLTVTTKGSTFLKRLQVVRRREFAAGTAGLSPGTRRRLAEVLEECLEGLGARG